MDSLELISGRINECIWLGTNWLLVIIPSHDYLSKILFKLKLENFSPLKKWYSEYLNIIRMW